MIGKTISHYTILERLGEGGMGVVYKAEDTQLGRTVALKFLPAHLTSDSAAKQRFYQEARSASNLDHNNICTIHEVGQTDDGETFIVMAYYDGETLADKIARGPLAVNEALDIVTRVAKGLAKAHNKGIVHRDIKPANIMITSDGVVKILDFGVAKLTGREQLTKTGATMGTVAYMSPEQARCDEIDKRTDIWSLGVVLYEMVTGKLPFKGDHEQAVLYSIVNEKPQSVTDVRKDLPHGLNHCLEMAMEKDADRRYQTIHEFVADLGLVKATTGTTGLPAFKQSKRPSRLGWLVVAVVLALVCVVVYLRWVGPAPMEPVPGMTKLAVLFFENLGPPDDEYFADGITDAITARLAGIHGLGVISRQSTIQYKESDKNIAVIGDELGADYILEGTIQRERPGDPTSRVRVIPQLIRVSDDIHLWAATYDEDMTEVFRVQSDIAERVADALDVTLLGSEREVLESIPTDNMEAYEYYLRGNKYYYDERDDYEKSLLAVAMYEEAVELDPEFAGAWAGLSQSYIWLFYADFAKEGDARIKAKAAVDRAIELDPDSPEAHLALGYYFYYGLLDYGRSLEHLNVARERMPNNVEVLTALGLVKRRQGNWDESVDLFEKVIDLNPRHSHSILDLGVNFIYLRRYDEAEECFDRVIALRPDLPSAYIDEIMTCLERDGNTERAEGILKRASKTVPPAELIDTPPFVHIRVMPEAYAEIFDNTPSDEWGIVADTILFNLGMAEIDRQLKREKRALAHYDSARVMIESRTLPPGGPRGFFGCFYGLAYSGLGLHDEATRIARDALQALPVSDDAVVGPQVAWVAAVIFVRAGEYDESLDLLELLSDIPSEISPGMLRVDPVWDPLRGHPRFQRLLEGDE